MILSAPVLEGRRFGPVRSVSAVVLSLDGGPRRGALSLCGDLCWQIICSQTSQTGSALAAAS